LEVSLLRQKVRGDPWYIVPPEVLSRMSGWLSAWHARRGDRVELVPVDLSSEEVLATIVRALGLRYAPHPVPEVIPYLVLLGRPASGKTELIHFLKGLPTSERGRAYHLGALRVLDDFPILWEWVVEFSRGGRETYAHALNLLPSPVLADGAILYLSVSYKESLRRNRHRYDRAHRDGLLTHSVPEEEMARTYQEDDWAELASKEAGYLTIRGYRVPYIAVPNEPEPKTFGDFSRRFWPALEELFWLWKNR